MTCGGPASWLRAILLAGVLAGPALAGITEADRAAAERRMQAFLTAAGAMDVPGMLGFIPPPMVDAIAAGMGLPRDRALAIMQDQFAAARNAVRMEDLAIGDDGIRAAVTPSGRDYLLIPSTATITTQGRRMRGTTISVGVRFEGEWYFARVDGPQELALLRRVYPDFATVDLPRGEMHYLD